MEFLTHLGVVLACIAGVLTIIGFVSDYTCHSYSIISRIFNTLYDITSAFILLFCPHQII